LPVHLKTDSAELYEFSVDSVSSFGAQIECSVEDIDAGTLPVEELEIPTYYERMHRDLGKTIKYLRFRL
jgi:tRNA (guanine-N7-)-methyltransferase